MNHQLLMPQPAPTENETAPRRRLALVPAAGVRPPIPHALRGDKLTAQRVEVGMIFLEMLGAEDAADYMLANAVPADVVARVLGHPQRRRAPAAA